LQNGSDVVALMVLTHQSEMHNRITRASFLTRQALHYEEALNKGLGEPTGHRWPSTTSRIKSACEPLLEYMLFTEETPLNSEVIGSSTFAKTFASRGQLDRKGRSLREFDLKTRLFKYPCSYLVYSDSYKNLPREAADYILKRLEEILAGLPAEVFTADDSLGWVYQYWQKDSKDEVNASERKVGGADIGPVTQLFTENYMVRFLLENSLGAWWAARHRT
jgi:hypothetical protein